MEGSLEELAHYRMERAKEINAQLFLEKVGTYVEQFQ